MISRCEAVHLWGQETCLKQGTSWSQAPSPAIICCHPNTLQAPLQCYSAASSDSSTEPLQSPSVKAHDQLIIMWTITNQNHPDNQHWVGQTQWLGQPTSAHNPPPPPPITNRPECKATGPWNTDAQPSWQTGQNAKHHALQISTENLPGSFLQNLTKLVISGTMADMNCRHMESASSFSLLRSGCKQTEQSTTDPLVHVPQHYDTDRTVDNWPTCTCTTTLWHRQNSRQLTHLYMYHNTMTQTEQSTTDPLVHVPQHYDTDRTVDNWPTCTWTTIPQHYDTDRTVDNWPTCTCTTTLWHRQNSQQLTHLYMYHNTTTLWHRQNSKLQALVYDILPSTTAIFSYAIGSRKLSANEQVFVGAQTVVSLLQRSSNNIRCLFYNWP